MEHKIYTTEPADNPVLEVGKLAEQANGACTVRYDTMVL